MTHVLTLILGGGRGTRLFPLTLMRSKPAVPLGGKYRLIDVPLSNCLHAGLRRIFVLTQFNSASLNRHVAETYRLDQFAGGFVEILAAEQTLEHANWFQGTADAVRQAMRHFVGYDADYYLVLAGDHLYRMDLAALVDAHARSRADLTIAAQHVSADEAPSMGIFRFDQQGRLVGFEEKPPPERLDQLRCDGRLGGPADPARPFVASMGIYVFSRDTLIELLETHPGVDFGREIIPAALGRYRVVPYFFRGYWVDVGTIETFYRANIQLTWSNPPFSFHDPRRPIFTRPRFLPPTRLEACRLRESIVAEGCFLDSCEIAHSVVGIRTRIGAGSRISRSVLLGADFYEDPSPTVPPDAPPLGIGRHVVLDRVIVDKNARIGDEVRLVNEAGVLEADGDGYFIRNGIIVVPKGAIVRPGTVV
jgi:glucose-1-phosphate adenylyltransferase